MKIVLLGYMGSGKSLIGKQLSQALNFNFIDLDHEIETIEKDRIKDIFIKKGEIYFRKREAEIMYRTLERNGDHIIALGGGTPCYGSIMDDLLSSDELITIYLKTTLESLTDRLYPEIQIRPLIAHLQTKDALNDFIRKHLFERSYYYNQAEIIVDTSNITIEKVVENIVARLF